MLVQRPFVRLLLLRRFGIEMHRLNSVQFSVLIQYVRFFPNCLCNSPTFPSQVWKCRAAAEDIYSKLELDDDRQAELIASAIEWRLAWEAQGNPDAPRKHLHVWLRDRHYMEDAPTGHKDRAPKPAKPERPAKPKPAPVAANNNEDDDLPIPPAYQWDVGPFSPFGTFEAVIVDSTVDWVAEYEQQVVLNLLISTPSYDIEEKHTFLGFCCNG